MPWAGGVTKPLLPGVQENSSFSFSPERDAVLLNSPWPQTPRVSPGSCALRSLWHAADLQPFAAKVSLQAGCCCCCTLVGASPACLGPSTAPGTNLCSGNHGKAVQECWGCPSQVLFAVEPFIPSEVLLNENPGGEIEVLKAKLYRGPGQEELSFET